MVVLNREPAILLVDTAVGVPDVMYGICIALSGVVICGSCDIFVAIVYLGSRRITASHVLICQVDCLMVATIYY